MYEHMRGKRFIRNSEVVIDPHFFQICLFEGGATIWYVWENDRVVSYCCDTEDESIDQYLRMHMLNRETIETERGDNVRDTWENIVMFIMSWREFVNDEGDII